MTRRLICCRMALICLLLAGQLLSAAAAEEMPSLLVATQPESAPTEGELPPVIVEAPAGDEPAAADFGPRPASQPAIDLSESYPDLTELMLGEAGPFGENTGVLRNRQSLFDSPGAVSVRTRQEMQERQAPDMLHALQNEVGVLIQSTAAGQASPYLRGLTGQQVLLMIDGIRLNNSVYRLGPNQYFNTIDPGMVDRIEVLRGQGSVLWGSDAIGGAINVVSRNADIHYGMFHDNYGGGEFTQYYNTSNSSPYTRMNAEGWVGATSFFGGGSYMNVRDLDTGYDDFGRQPGTNYQQYAGDIKLNYLIDSDQMITFATQHYEQEDLARSDRFPGYPYDLDNSNTVNNATFFDPQQRDLAYLRYQALEPIELIDALTLTTSYHRQREIQTRGVLTTTRRQEIDVETAGVQLTAAKDLSVLGVFTTGVDWYHDDVDSPFAGAGAVAVIPDDGYYERIGWFTGWDVWLTERLALSSGVRYELIDAGATPILAGVPTHIAPNYNDWVGQVGLVYELERDVHLVGSISEGFRAPNLDELAGQQQVQQLGQDVPSLGLAPEHSINYEIGLKTNFDRLRTQQFVYWMDLEDQIVAVPAGANRFARDNQDSYLYGYEVDGELLLTDFWSAYGNFWYTYGVNLEADAPLSRIPPAQGIVGLRFRDPRVRSYFTVYTWLVRRQDRLDPVRDFADERTPIDGTPGYGTLNMRVGRAFGSRNEHLLSLSLENITDKAYLVHGSGVFGTGFTSRFGYTLTY